MENHNCGTEDAQHTANFPMDIQPLTQEVWREHSTDDENMRLYILDKELMFSWDWLLFSEDE